MLGHYWDIELPNEQFLIVGTGHKFILLYECKGIDGA